MNAEEEKIQAIQDSFQNLSGKRILVYGSGVWASRVLAALRGFKIVGVLDRVLTDGTFGGIPVLTWEGLHEDDADMIIIAAPQNYYGEIFQRIAPDCERLGLVVYGANGRWIVRTEPLVSFYAIEDILYFDKNLGSLKTAIDASDAVSFDFFDTLVMRRVLEPADIFTVLERRLTAAGIAADGFAAKRIAAARESKNAPLHEQYEILNKKLNLPPAVLATVLQTELDCEKEGMVPRRPMVEAFKYALSQGKTVSIICDTCLPASFITDILNTFGITGYAGLYLSGECGKNKSNGLYDIYIRTVRATNLLHIGTDKQTDVAAPERLGIKTFCIKKSCDLLRTSTLSGLLRSARTFGDRLFLGMLAADLLNDPFVFYKTSGVPHIGDIAQFAYFFIPFVAVYMQELYDVCKQKGYDGILFSARDCYLFNRIYESGLLNTDNLKIPAYYFLTSRKSALKAAFCEEKNLEAFRLEINDSRKFGNILQNMYASGRNSYTMTELAEQSQATRTNYELYIKKLGLKPDGAYLFCDLISSGTVHDALKKSFFANLDGFYVYKGSSKKKLPVRTVYADDEWENKDDIRNFLEKIFTSPYPSVDDMGKDGEPVYARDARSKDELKAVADLHEAILSGISRWTGENDRAYPVSKQFAKATFETCTAIVLESDACAFTSMTLDENLTNDVLNTIHLTGGGYESSCRT